MPAQWPQLRLHQQFANESQLKLADSGGALQGQSAGLKTVLITGDNPRAAQSIASRVGIDEVFSGIRPEGKAELVKQLQERGAKVAYYDPYVPVIKPTREHSHWAGTKSVEWNKHTITGSDCVLLATNHACFNYKELADWAVCIVDTRNAMSGFATRPGQVWKA